MDDKHHHHHNTYHNTPTPQKHTSESSSLRTQVSNLQSQLDTLSQQASRLKSVEKQLDRSQLALEELQQAHEALQTQHDVLAQRAARAVAVNWSALVPEAWVMKIQHAMAPIQPTLHAAWSGVRETTSTAWAGVCAAYKKYAPLVVAHTAAGWRVVKVHSVAAWDAGVAYVRDSGLVCVCVGGYGVFGAVHLLLQKLCFVHRVEIRATQAIQHKHCVPSHRSTVCLHCCMKPRY